MSDLIERQAAIDAVAKVSKVMIEDERLAPKKPIRFSYKTDELMIQFMLGILVGAVIMMVIFTRSM